MTLGTVLVIAGLLAVLALGFAAGRYLLAANWHWALKLLAVLATGWAVARGANWLTMTWVVAHAPDGSHSLVEAGGYLGMILLGIFVSIGNTIFAVLAWFAGLLLGFVAAGNGREGEAV